MNIMLRSPRLASTAAWGKLCNLQQHASFWQVWPEDVSRSTTPDPSEFDWPEDINEYDWGDDGPHPEAAVTKVSLCVQCSKYGVRTLAAGCEEAPGADGLLAEYRASPCRSRQ